MGSVQVAALLLLSICLSCNTQFYDHVYFECLHHFSWTYKGEKVTIAPTSYMHLREDSLGETCLFLKLLFRHAVMLLFEMYPKQFKLISSKWHDKSFLHLAASHLKNNPPVEISQDDDDKKVTIEIGDIEISSFWQKWTDNRLAWNRHKSFTEYHLKIDKNVKKIKVFPAHIWLPDFAFMRGTHYAAEQDVTKTAQVSRKGGVTMHLHSGTAGKCDMNYRDFPNDKHTCCVYIQSKKYPDLIAYTLTDKQKVTTHKDAYIPAWWKLIDKTASLDFAEQSSGKNSKPLYPRVKICLTLQRYGTIFIYKVVLPLAAATFLAILIPFFTSWRMQIGTKLLAVGLLFFSVMFTNDEKAAFGPSVPRFVQIYDFLIWTTIVSVSLTIILWGLTFQTRFYPPPHTLTLITNVINPLFCWTNPVSDIYISFNGSDAETSEERGPAKQIKNYNKEWNAVYLGINNILLVLFTIIYILGLIICAV